MAIGERELVQQLAANTGRLDAMRALVGGVTATELRRTYVALGDPVPRVRRNAAHALGCVACKPDWHGTLPADITAQLEHLEASDPNAKDRVEAQYALSCRSATAGPGTASKPEAVT